MKSYKISVWNNGKISCESAQYAKFQKDAYLMNLDSHDIETNPWKPNHYLSLHSKNPNPNHFSSSSQCTWTQKEPVKMTRQMSGFIWMHVMMRLIRHARSLSASCKQIEPPLKRNSGWQSLRPKMAKSSDIFQPRAVQQIQNIFQTTSINNIFNLCVYLCTKLLLLSFANLVLLKA